MSDSKVCVVAGVGPGTGASLTRRFAREGYQVAMLARSAGRIEAIAAEVLGTHAFAVDLTDREAVQATFAVIRERLGPVDVLLQNAAAGSFKEFMDLEPEALERNFQVNTMSLLHCGQEAARDMLDRGAGS
ncbi:MAG: SDR family NAD(P)-dependent oxidoreductase, partial [Acidobacteriota bacterium]|nr:SDR family NAD(P)-dependent oxidoreductase [Acidobacteriota bacterium]